MLSVKILNYFLSEIISNNFTVLSWQQIIFSIFPSDISIENYFKHIKISSGTNFSSILYSPLKSLEAEAPALEEGKQLEKRKKMGNYFTRFFFHQTFIAKNTIFLNLTGECYKERKRLWCSSQFLQINPWHIKRSRRCC